MGPVTRTDQDLRKKIGGRIHDTRIKKGYSQETLAAMLGISVAFVGLIERGNRGCSLRNLLNILKILEIDFDELVKDIDDESLTIPTCLSDKEKQKIRDTEIKEKILYKLALLDMNELMLVQNVVTDLVNLKYGCNISQKT